MATANLPNPLPVVPIADAAAYTTETNSTITTGGSAKTVLAANGARTRLIFQNLSVEDMWLKTTGTPTIGGGLWFPPGAYKDWPAHDVPSGDVKVISSTTGSSYFVAEG